MRRCQMLADAITSPPPMVEGCSKGILPAPLLFEKVKDNKTPYELRHKTAFKGGPIPFGCAVHYKPSSLREISEMQKFGSKMRNGIFFRYHMHSGSIWSGDCSVLDYISLVKAMSGDDCNFRTVTGHRMKGIIPPIELQFPIAEMEQLDGELPGVADESDSECETDLPPVVPKPPAGGNSTPDVRSDDSDGEESDDNPVAVEEDSWEYNSSVLIRHHRR